ncbi:hypothetical protein QM480_15595 [Flectobacillus sp. DC10W]|uniref:Uncharacterized protein n=1 Tax=Flectobacillus longus TaxID=2984207 RepID=A0ABT6YRJ8_9BACT|nr:hypothetical protein [Flectobacillus longus]MDI9865768.1 hypothetical protein [Flectobacillus longus]
MTQQQMSVDLAGKHLSKIPDSVFQHIETTYLDLGSSNVTFYPPLSALVDTNSNNISYISEKIGSLTNLKILILNTNQLRTLPKSIVKLKNLEVLDLSINKDLVIIQHLDNLKQLPKLKVLKIVDVKMTKQEANILKAALSPDTKVIVTIPPLVLAS